MAESNDAQATAGQAGQTSQGPETLDHLQQLSREAAVARIEATVARTEANIVHLDRGMSETRGDVKDVQDRLVRLEANVAHVPSRAFVIFAVLVAVVILTAATLFQDTLLTILGLAG